MGDYWRPRENGIIGALRFLFGALITLIAAGSLVQIYWTNRAIDVPSLILLGVFTLVGISMMATTIRRG